MNLNKEFLSLFLVLISISCYSQKIKREIDPFEGFTTVSVQKKGMSIQARIASDTTYFISQNFTTRKASLVDETKPYQLILKDGTKLDLKIVGASTPSYSAYGNFFALSYFVPKENISALINNPWETGRIHYISGGHDDFTTFSNFSIFNMCLKKLLDELGVQYD